MEVLILTCRFCRERKVGTGCIVPLARSKTKIRLSRYTKRQLAWCISSKDSAFSLYTYPVVRYSTLTYPILSYSILPYSTLSYPVLPSPVLSYPILPFPALPPGGAKTSHASVHVAQGPSQGTRPSIVWYRPHYEKCPDREMGNY